MINKKVFCFLSSLISFTIKQYKLQDITNVIVADDKLETWPIIDWMSQSIE